MKGAGADDPFPLPQTGLDFRYIIQGLTRPDGPRLKCGLRFSDKDHVASVHLLNGRSGYDKGSSAEMMSAIESQRTCRASNARPDSPPHSELARFGSEDRGRRPDT